MGADFDNEQGAIEFMNRVTSHILRELGKRENLDLAVIIQNHGIDNGVSLLNETQAARLEAILDPIDDGWTGALYHVIMQEVQVALRERSN